MVASYHKGTVLYLCLVGICILMGCNSTLPGFVGIPEELDRSRDFSLPLESEADIENLLGFMLLDGTLPSRSWSMDDEDPGKVQLIRDTYEPLLKFLAERAPTKEDLRAGTGALAQLFDNPTWILDVHDARVGRDENGDYYDLDSERSRALVKGDFVFAFYLRRLKPVMVTKEQVPDLGVEEGVVWILEDQESDVYSGLVVFHKTYAVSTPGE